jgi:hypothetical protein
MDGLDRQALLAACMLEAPRDCQVARHQRAAPPPFVELAAATRNCLVVFDVQMRCPRQAAPGERFVAAGRPADRNIGARSRSCATWREGRAAGS